MERAPQSTNNNNLDQISYPRKHAEFKYSLYPPSVIAWACLMQAMEMWQITSDHLHLTLKIQNHISRKITATS